MDCPGFHIVHFGIYDTRVSWLRKQHTPNRYIFQFELEFCTEDLGGIAYLEGNSYPLKDGMFLCCKPGQQRSNRLFTGFFGSTPYAFTLACRIEAAMASLQADHCNLADIAAACGFSSQSHFSAQFKKVTGQTPLQYRRSLLSQAQP